MFPTRIFLRIVDLLAALAQRNYAFYCWLLAHFPAWSERVGLLMAWRAFAQAQEQVPAYSLFLARQNARQDYFETLAEQFASIPETDKNAYVRAFPTAERCVDGCIPAQHVIVDESSGSTGLPYNWVRSRAEVLHTRRACSYFHRYYFGNQPLFIINAFSMGAWATGVTIGAALDANGIVKSTGPDLDKILHTLRFFGPGYRYLITGYPPFLKRLLDYGEEQGLDWSAYHLLGMVGGEGMSEGLRRYLLRHFEKILSGYGASDLEVGVAAESDLSIALRQLMEARPEIREALIGADHRVPMLFQYNPLDHYIEVNANRELVVTITRSVLSPRIRYNVKDEGGIISYAEVCRRLRQVGIDIQELLPKGARWARLPFLYVFGRRDSTISYMGANIYPEDVEVSLFASRYASRLGAFCMELLEDEHSNEARPCIHVEVMNGELTDTLRQSLQEALLSKLCELNADFRQAVHEDERASELQIVLHQAGQGPFAQNAGRIKRRYIIEAARQARSVSAALLNPTTAA
jgi:phenylacetate-CoA ligase